jgi:hypothetical protein
MNEKIKNYLLDYFNKNCFEQDKISERDFEEILLYEARPIYEKEIRHRRWWTDYFTVVKIGDILIGFNSAKTTGDDSRRDKGWEFDLNSICEVEAKEKTIIIYEPKGKK